MTYHRPAGLEDALSLLHRLGPDARVLAGGQDIVPLMNQGRVRPSALIDLKALSSIDRIQRRNGSIIVGAWTTHRSLERSEQIRCECGLLAEAASQIGGGVQVRNRGTIGGAVCSGNPVYDYAPCLVAMDAEFRIMSLTGERIVMAREFFRDAHVTALRPDELLLGIVVPAFDPSIAFAYEKLTFTEGCYNIASAAAIVELGPDGAYTRLRLAIGGVAPVPLRLREVETMLSTAQPTDDLLADAAALTEQHVSDPMTDVLADGEYRRAMAGV
ncbi:MAG: FAD binding domain-containing protein, partial [Armatimonadota bacterium]